MPRFAWPDVELEGDRDNPLSCLSAFEEEEEVETAYLCSPSSGDEPVVDLRKECDALRVERDALLAGRRRQHRYRKELGRYTENLLAAIDQAGAQRAELLQALQRAGVAVPPELLPSERSQNKSLSASEATSSQLRRRTPTQMSGMGCGSVNVSRTQRPLRGTSRSGTTGFVDPEHRSLSKRCSSREALLGEMEVSSDSERDADCSGGRKSSRHRDEVSVKTAPSGSSRSIGHVDMITPSPPISGPLVCAEPQSVTDFGKAHTSPASTSSLASYSTNSGGGSASCGDGSGSHVGSSVDGSPASCGKVGRQGAEINLTLAAALGLSAESGIRVGRAKFAAASNEQTSAHGEDFRASALKSRFTLEARKNSSPPAAPGAGAQAVASVVVKPIGALRQSSAPLSWGGVAAAAAGAVAAKNAVVRRSTSPSSSPISRNRNARSPHAETGACGTAPPAGITGHSPPSASRAHSPMGLRGSVARNPSPSRGATVGSPSSSPVAGSRTLRRVSSGELASTPSALVTSPIVTAPSGGAPVSGVGSSVRKARSLSPQRPGVTTAPVSASIPGKTLSASGASASAAAPCSLGGSSSSPSLWTGSGARQKKLDRENWARRGIGATSPPPRTNSVAAVAGAADAKVSTKAPVNSIAAAGPPRVIVRCRPPDFSEAVCTSQRAIYALDATTLEVRESSAGSLQRQFAVDGAFGENSKTADVFSTMRGLVRRAALGGSSAVIAYGPTGAGKTHTMYGDTREPGLVLLAASELLSRAAGLVVRMSMLELHNEGLSDLLVQKIQPGCMRPRDTSATILEVRGGSGGSMATIEGAREVACSSVASTLSTLRSGFARRKVAATMLNATSSRSHLVVVFRIGTGQLTLVDLAGVERVKRSGAEGNVLREAQSINRSLQSLGDVVDALRRGACHVPVRNSRLARLISGALGGSAETAVVVCVAPDVKNREEAVAALCFADRVRRIPAATAADCSDGARRGQNGAVR